MFLDVGTRVGQKMGSKSAELKAQWSIVVNLVQGPLNHCMGHPENLGLVSKHSSFFGNMCCLPGFLVSASVLFSHA